MCEIRLLSYWIRFYTFSGIFGAGWYCWCHSFCAHIDLLSDFEVWVCVKFKIILPEWNHRLLISETCSIFKNANVEKDKPPCNAQELEDCDIFPEDSSSLTRFDGDSLRPSHVVRPPLPHTALCRPPLPCLISASLPLSTGSSVIRVAEV